jgi:hypothetical protein
VNTKIRAGSSAKRVCFFYPTSAYALLMICPRYDGEFSFTLSHINVMT